MSNINFVRQFNELFQKINIQGTEKYFSGSRFLSVIREFDSAYPNYTQYIDIRKAQGKSTSRKDYYYDILLEFEEDIRQEIINRIYEIIDTNNETNNNLKTDNEPLNSIFKKVEHTPLNIKSSQKETSNIPLKVFISYSWDSEEHKEWILKFATDLRTNGVDIILDRYELRGGKNIPHFMETAIESADKVLIVFTENYKLKASGRSGGVGYEYSLLNNEICQNITNNNKYIPILKSGSIQTSVPFFMKQYIAVDMTSQLNYDESLREVLHCIFDRPIIKKPEIGQVPEFLK